MRLLFLLSILFFFTASYSQSDFYKIKIKGIKNDSIDFANLRGKMVLIVNTATDSSEYQLNELELLQQKFKDSGLVVLAVPSNDFNNEKASTEVVKSRYDKYDFDVTEKQSVKGSQQSPLYAWLCNGSLNGITDNIINGDFKKFLINRKGRLVGAFHERSSVKEQFFLSCFKENK
jgi:glutathione peroxidase